MKTYLSIILCLLFSFTGVAQNQTIGSPTGTVTVAGKLIIKSAPMVDTTNTKPVVLDASGNVLRLQSWPQTGKKIPGGVISSLPAVGNNPGIDITADSFIVSQFYASQPPTASLSGGGMYEFTTAGTTNRTLTWTAGRQSATSPFSTIVVGGVNQTFTQPTQSGNVSGTRIVGVVHNTNTNYNNIVTTTDGKVAQATTTFIYQHKIYAGFVNSATPTDAEIIAATGSVYVGGTFSGARNQSGSLSTPSSSKYIVFASPASYSTPNVVINGLGVTYNQTTRSFTNASGGVSSYTIAVSPFSTAGQIDSYIIN